MERIARDKCSSVSWKGVTYGRKKFYNIGPSGLYCKNITIVNDNCSRQEFLQYP